MLGQILRVAVRLSAGVVLGAVPGTLYAGLVGAVHLGVSASWRFNESATTRARGGGTELPTWTWTLRRLPANSKASGKP